MKTLFSNQTRRLCFVKVIFRDLSIFSRYLASCLLLPALAFSQVQLLKDVKQGSGSSTNRSDPFSRTVTIGDWLLMVLDDGVHGSELWKSDGTTAGTVLVKDINPGVAGSSLVFLRTIDGVAYFVATDGQHGQELWKSDGTAAGTELVKDIRPGVRGAIAHSYPFGGESNGLLYFVANDGVHGLELWKSDGSTDGTVLVKDINPGNRDANPAGFTDVNGSLYFIADDGSHGEEIWKSDGTASGTNLYLELEPGTASTGVYSMAAYRGGLYFTAIPDYGRHNVGSTPITLYRSDGLSGKADWIEDYGSYELSDIPVALIVFRERLFLAINTMEYSDLDYYRPASVTVFLPDSVSGLSPVVSHTGYFNLQVMAGKLCLVGSQVYVSDTGEEDDFHNVTPTNTTIINSIFPEVTVIGNSLYFLTTRNEIWGSNGLQSVKLADGDGLSGAKELAAIGSTLVFSACDATVGCELRKLDVSLIPPPLCSASGSILREVWANLPNGGISSIPFDTPPTFADTLTVLRTRANYADGYGQRIRGHLCAPVSGSYQFFLQGDDLAELYLSTDKDPAKKQKIASAIVSWAWTDQPSQQSAPVTLVAGESYYVEILHKERAGGDQVRVGWRTPDMASDSEPIIVPGSVLSPFRNRTQAPATLTATVYGDASVRLIWPDVRDETGYVLERATATGGPYTRIATVAGLTKPGFNELQYLDQFLPGSTPFYYRVYATSAHGATAYSNVASATTPDLCSASGTILREWWSDLPAGGIASIPVNSPPSSSEQLNSFRTPANSADHYGQRIRGYIRAPYSGSYRFFLQGDDVAELSLSTDENPANKSMIAHVKLSWDWIGNASQQSAPVSLVAGQRYYVEILHKENSGGDVLRVGWRTPGMAAESEPFIIPGCFLSPFVPVAPEPIGRLVACYSFSGNANDGSGEGNHGTIQGAVPVPDRFANANSAYDFNGNSDYIAIPDQHLKLNQYSYSLWTKPASFPDFNYDLLSVGGFYGQRLMLVHNYNGHIYESGWAVSSTNALGSVSFGSTGMLPSLNAWYHLVMIRDSSSIKLYVNGTLAVDVAADSSANYGDMAYIGALGDLGQYVYQGIIDDVQVYDHALSSAQVNILYQLSSAPCPGRQAVRLVADKQRQFSSSLIAYPNPTTGTTTVEFTALETGWLDVQLFDLQGKLLKQIFGQQVEAGSTHQQSLDASSLPAGLYVLRSLNCPQVTTQMLVITR